MFLSQLLLNVRSLHNALPFVHSIRAHELLVLVLAIIIWQGLNALAVQRSKAARRRREQPRCLRAMERGRLVVLGHASPLCVVYKGVCGCKVGVGMRSRLARQTPEIA